MASKQLSTEVFSNLKNRFGGSSLELKLNEHLSNEDSLVLYDKELVLSVVTELLHTYPFLVDVCGVDYPERAKRFDVVYHFADPKKQARLRLKVQVAETETLSSVTSVYKGANWFEREVYDLFGVHFEGHIKIFD